MCVVFLFSFVYSKLISVFTQLGHADYGEDLWSHVNFFLHCFVS